MSSQQKAVELFSDGEQQVRLCTESAEALGYLFQRWAEFAWTWDGTGPDKGALDRLEAALASLQRATTAAHHKCRAIYPHSVQVSGPMLPYRGEE